MTITKRVPTSGALAGVGSSIGTDTWGGTFGLTWGRTWFFGAPASGAATTASPAVDALQRVLNTFGSPTAGYGFSSGFSSGFRTKGTSISRRSSLSPSGGITKRI